MMALRIARNLAWIILILAQTRSVRAVEAEADVFTILRDRCLSCHDGLKKAGGLGLATSEMARAGGESGPAIVAFEPGESLLLDLVEGARPAMPKDGRPLTAGEVARLRRWIAEGASWPEGLVLRSSPEDRETWWSFRPLRDRARPPTAAGLPEGWADDPIDRWIFRALEAEGLEPAPMADRRTLIRRATFDLTGLPPGPEDVERFVRDDRPEAYAELIDRLLASPRYGERWARHWLDVVRFGESDGYQLDAVRDHAWPYRDYVIRSFNQDKPFDRFIREQIAGDVAEPRTSDGIIAAGFLVAGPYDKMGIEQASPVMRRRAREEELEDMVATVAQTFLGLTVNCARCHDHKYDPIPSRDYYRFKASLEFVWRGRKAILPPSELKHRDPSKPTAITYTVDPIESAPTRVLARGDVERPGPTVAPGGLSALAGPAADFGLAADAHDAPRRLKLADWLADPANPLPARVLVNRVWQYHFGTGLVATPNDFGAHGDRPSHPELLDWLASTFRASGYRIKPLQRRIMLTRAYRQSSRSDARAAAIDGGDRLLWRFPPRRLEAEELRDAILKAGGQLDLRPGGPGFRPFKMSISGSAFFELIDPVGPEFNRRSIYRIAVRSASYPLLDTFDCPDPSVRTPRRSVTTTPLQALTLMNDPFVVRQARALARRVALEAGASRAKRIDRAYRHALGRAPSPVERRRALAVAEAHGLETVCWALFNTSEFLHVR